MTQSEREFDVVVWGATGFTGRLVAQYLSKQYGVGGNLKWAMGGRSEEKLQAVRDEIGAAGAPLVIGDASHAPSLRALAEQAKVICTTVGPYQKYGSGLIAACVEAGTDYVDLCGEPPWMRKMIDAHQVRAIETGARITFSCGFDSIPFDLGVLFLQEAAKAGFGAPCVEVKGLVRAMKGKVSGGTAASLLATVEAAAHDPMVREVMRDPYALAPDDSTKRPRQPDGHTPRYDTDANSWVAPFVMADINTRNVHRSNMLTDYAYGEDFRYSEMTMAANAAAAYMIAAGLGAFLGLTSFGPTRAVLKKFALPDPGEGPNRRERENGYYKLRFIGKTTKGDHLIITVAGDMDPGYGSTSKMLGESAVCLAQDITKGAPGGGFWTPASAMGAMLIERLQKNAGLTFERLQAL